MGEQEPGVTTVTQDEVYVVSRAPERVLPEEKAVPDDVISKKLICRKCGKVGEHWTSKCPFQGILDGDAVDGEGASAAAAAGGGGGGGGGCGGGGFGPGGDGEADDGEGGANRYIPPSQRAGASARGAFLNRNEENTLRVTNLSDDATENDLRDLFTPFGHITRLYLATDRHTGLPRGFAFVTYVHRRDAESAMARLNGHCYGYLVLSVSWADKRTDKYDR